MSRLLLNEDYTCRTSVTHKVDLNVRKADLKHSSFERCLTVVVHFTVCVVAIVKGDLSL